MPRHGGRIVAIERYPHDKVAMATPIKTVAQAAVHADAIFIPDGGDAAPEVAQGLVTDGVNTKKAQLLGSGLWEDDQRITSATILNGAWYVAPDPSGYRNTARYRARLNRSRSVPRRSLTMRSRSSQRW